MKKQRWTGVITGQWRTATYGDHLEHSYLRAIDFFLPDPF